MLSLIKWCSGVVQFHLSTFVRPLGKACVQMEDRLD